ncbi:hypothetical protein HY634_04660 [Candidatus Uhrbacteria bacterium]|nr:hypothetical protein [Candidatus Uhrbacteria bacterium]
MASPLDGDMRPSTPEELAEDSRRIRAAFDPKPLLVPYEVWSEELDALCRERRIPLAHPRDLSIIFSPFHREGEREREEPMSIFRLLYYQEAFYRSVYTDPQFTIDRAKLGLPRERLDDIKAALLRGEVDYPLVTCLPRTLSEEELGFSPSSRGGATRPDRSVGRGGGGAPVAAAIPRTLHRVLFDRLIRGMWIKVWERTDPDLNTFLEQVRDLSLADLTRTDLTDADGKPLSFTGETWLPYLHALYPQLPRPAATPGYTDLSFVKWERDPPADRVIEGARGPNGEPVTIQAKSQLDAVSLRYPLITPSHHLTLFSQYCSATGEHLDTDSWSWTFGIVDPVAFFGWPSVYADWTADGLILDRYRPGYANSSSRLRSSR